MPEIQERGRTGLTVLGILCTVLGLLWSIASLWGLLQPTTITAMLRQFGAPQILNRPAEIWAYTDAGLNFILAIVLFAAGVGLLRMKAWGAKLAIGYGIARIALSAVSFLFTWLGPIAHRPGAKDMEGFPELYQVFMKTQFWSVAFTLAFASLVISIAFAVILLSLLSRPSYREALSS